MRKLRYIVFGYQVVDGEIAPHPVEANLVRQMYSLYLKGSSYSEISKAMKETSYPYNNSKEDWNKSVIGRILKNSKYIGDIKYPAIIEKDAFEKVGAFQEHKFTRKNIEKPLIVQALKNHVYCGECSERYVRVYTNRDGEKWKCKNVYCKTHIKITDKFLESTVIEILNIAIQNPAIIEMPVVKPMPLNLDITRIKNEIDRETDKMDCNEEYAKTLIMACAAEKYKICSDGSEQRATQQIKEILKSQYKVNELDTDFFNIIVSKVLIEKSGEMSIELKNNQILGKEK